MPAKPEKFPLLRVLRYIDIKAHRMGCPIFEALGLTGTQGQVLGCIALESRTRDVFQRDIEEVFYIRRPTATGILKLLEKNGFIERVGVPTDARLKKLVLTDKARAIMEKIMGEVEAVELALRARLTEHEAKTLLRLLQKVCDGL